MFQTCPKCGYQRKNTDAVSEDECPGCGIIFSKWQKHQNAQQAVEEQLAKQIAAAKPVTDVSARQRVVAFFFRARDDISVAEFATYCLIFVGLSLWGYYFIQLNYESAEIGRSFMHSVNLVFHEAGHVIFAVFGRFMSIVGGSLLQVLLPLMLLFAFLINRREGFGASVCLWWAGQSLMDLAPYIADAKVMRLPLLGGGTGFDMPGAHDWNNILREAGRIDEAIQIAESVDRWGAFLVILALLWSALMLRKYLAILRAPDRDARELTRDLTRYEEFERTLRAPNEDAADD